MDSKFLDSPNDFKACFMYHNLSLYSSVFEILTFWWYLKSVIISSCGSLYAITKP